MFIKYNVVDQQLFNNLSGFFLSEMVYNAYITHNSEPIPTTTPQVNTVNDVVYLKKDFQDVVFPTAFRKKNSYFTPEQEDALFWCIFTLKFGSDEYNLIETKYKNHEIKEKMCIVDYLNKHKTAMKSMKISKTVTQEIMGKLMTNNITDLQTLHGICAYYKLHVFVVNSKKMTYIDYDYSNSDDTNNDDIFVIYKSNSLLSNTKCKYSIKTNINKGEITNIVENFVKFESFEKPFNGISTYKLLDLENIHKKLGLENTKRNKNELYTQINLAVV